MSTKAREAEARAADLAFQIALAQMGQGTIEDALAVWAALDAAAIESSTDSWLERSVRLILVRRRIARDLAMAYYRLSRALRTGKTIADPFHPEPDGVTLGELRREFSGLVAEIDRIHQPAGQPEQDAVDAGTELLSEEGAQDDETFTEGDALEGDAERIILEAIENLREVELKFEDSAEKAILEELFEIGPKWLDQQLAKMPPETTMAEAAEILQQAYAKAGAQVALSSERVVLNGGRGSVYNYGNRDPRAIGWARVSKSGNPCYFCGVLISRGAVYKSEASATFDSDGDLYHNDCKCMAVPIYSRAQYETDPRFDQNRELGQLWKKDFKGKGDALKLWRAHFEEQRAQPNGAPWAKPALQETPAREAG